MSRYIDADAFKSWIDEYVSVFKKSDKAEIKGYISHQPSIDIVRCGECKMWINEHLCQWWSRYGTVETDANDFCSRGERKCSEKPNNLSEIPTSSKKTNNSTISKMEQVEDEPQTNGYQTFNGTSVYVSRLTDEPHTERSSE